MSGKSGGKTPGGCGPLDPGERWHSACHPPPAPCLGSWLLQQALCARPARNESPCRSPDAPAARVTGMTPYHDQPGGVRRKRYLGLFAGQRHRRRRRRTPQHGTAGGIRGKPSPREAFFGATPFTRKGYARSVRRHSRQRLCNLWPQRNGVGEKPFPQNPKLV